MKISIDGVVRDMTPEEEQNYLSENKKYAVMELASEISSLKSELAEEDYKVLKCYEYSLVNKPLPYNIVELNNKRDILREKINQLEKEVQANASIEV